MDKPQIDFKPITESWTASLPDYLKDPKNYWKIQKRIVDSVQTTCAHSEVYEMAVCKKCTEKMIERRKLLRELGFKNARQYMAWRKVMEEIMKRPKWVDTMMKLGKQ